MNDTCLSGQAGILEHGHVEASLMTVIGEYVRERRSAIRAEQLRLRYLIGKTYLLKKARRKTRRASRGD